MFVCARARAYVCVCVGGGLSVCACMSVCVCVCVCMLEGGVFLIASVSFDVCMLEYRDAAGGEGVDAGRDGEDYRGSGHESG